MCVYYKGMKTIKKTIFVAMILALALALVLSFDMSSVAHATGTEAGETFAFNFDNGEFTLTRNSTSEVIYRSATYVTDDIVEAIKSVVGEDGNYNIEIPAPAISVEVTKGGNKQPFSQNEDKFTFTATATHPFDSVPIMEGYSKVDTETGFSWRFSRNNGAETSITGGGHTIDFGRNNAYGNYSIFAYGTVSLTIDGKVFTAKGKSVGVDIEIQKASGDDVQIEENSLYAERRVYGMTVEEIVESRNTQGNLTYKFELATDQENSLSGDTILDAIPSGEYHGILVYYVVGDWEDGEFIPNESVEKVLVTLNVSIIPREVRILINHAKINVGDSVDFNNIWEYLTPPQQGVKASDLGLSFRLETEDGEEVAIENVEAGVYYIRGLYTNKNYEVIFLDFENQNKNDYSRRAVLTVRPIELTTSDDNFNYTVKCPTGNHFEVGDNLQLVDGIDGGKTLKIFNGDNAVEYDNLTLVIERKSADTSAILLYIDGQWKEYPFDNQGKVTVSYSTTGDNADNFGVKVFNPNPPEKEKTDNTVAIACGVVAGVVLLVAIILLVMYLKKKKSGKTDDNNADESADKSENEVACQDNNEESTEKSDNTEKEEKAPLTLEEKYALHPEFVPTPSVEDAFKGVETEDNQEDEKDNDESAEEGKITFKSKMLGASVENRAIYNALKNNILSYKGVKSRVVNGGDYFRRPGKQIVKIIFIGKTIRLALALNPDDYDYNVYHQKNRGAMKKYSDTPMFVKVQSLLGVRRAFKLIADLMEKEGVKMAKKPQYDDHLYNLTYYNNEE